MRLLMRLQTNQILLPSLLACLLLLGPSIQAQEAQPSRPGVSDQKPADGRFVEVDGKFMVPYKTRIPGTDIEFEMVPIPGGTFTMGSPADEEGRGDDEGPQFQVVVEPFWMGKHEVTWGEYQRFMAMDRVFKALDRKQIRPRLDAFQIDAVTAPSALYDESFTYEAGQADDQPAATISQFAAKQYTKWLSLMSGDFYRLPTEAEWEYACRAGTTTAFYFGDDADLLEEHAWMVDNADEERHPVGQLKPNPWGLYDMYGNVAEWVLDGYQEDGYPHVQAGAQLTTKEAFYQAKDIFPRVVRGGSWELDPEYCRSAARLGSDVDWKYEDPNFPKSPWWFTDTPGLGVGFRLMRPYQVPASMEAKSAYWNADVEELEENSLNRIDANGRGALGSVDQKLPEQIKGLPDSDK